MPRTAVGATGAENVVTGAGFAGMAFVVVPLEPSDGIAGARKADDFGVARDGIAAGVRVSVLMLSDGAVGVVGFFDVGKALMAEAMIGRPVAVATAEPAFFNKSRIAIYL